MSKTEVTLILSEVKMTTVIEIKYFLDLELTQQIELGEEYKQFFIDSEMSRVYSIRSWKRWDRSISLKKIKNRKLNLVWSRTVESKQLSTDSLRMSSNKDSFSILTSTSRLDFSWDSWWRC